MLHYVCIAIPSHLVIITVLIPLCLLRHVSPLHLSPSKESEFLKRINFEKMLKISAKTWHHCGALTNTEEGPGLVHIQAKNTQVRDGKKNIPQHRTNEVGTLLVCK